MFERSLVLLWGLGVIGCGAPSNANESGGGKSGTVTQAIVTGTISASPNPCLVAAGSSTCTTNVSWSGASSSFATLYQILVRMDAGPYKLVSCGNVLSNPGPVPAPWIVAGHTYRFSLRGPATDCAAPAVAAPELAAVTVDGITVRMSASNVDAAFSPSPVLVPSGSPNLGTTTISYAASYGSNMNNVVWVSEFNGATWSPYTNFSCGFQGGAYSDSAPWIQAGHVYRFSLRPTSLPCSTADNTYAEVASVTVQGFTSYLKPEQDRCSTTATGSCSTVLHFGSNTTSTAVAVDMSTNGGASWSFVGCSTGHQGTLPTGPIPHDTQALFRLHSGNLCGPTDGPVLATASVFALSNMVVPNKTSLQLGGTDLREIGMNKFDLFRQYIMKPDYQHALSCSESPSLSAQSQAEQGVIDAAAKGVRYLRVAGIGFYAYSPFSTPPDTEPFELKMWQNCPATYWARFDAMLAFVRSRGLKLIVNLDWNQCMFPDLVREHLGDMVKNPASQSRQKLLQYAQDLVTRYKNDTTIQGWELVNELDSLADLDLSHATTLCPYVESPADDYSTDDMVHFMQSFATSVRSWDPKHLISGGYTDLRPAAAHLRARPGFLANGSPNPNMDWTADDRNMFDSEVRYLNPDPIDVVSMHVYNGDLNGDPNLPSDPTRTNMRFGLSGFYNADILDYYKWSSDHVGKPLFVGEFNDAWDCATGCGFPTDPRRNFARAELLKLAALHIPLSTQWAWELSDGPTWYGIKPGADALTDEYIGVYQSMNSYIERTANSVDLTPANAGFELDTNGDGVPDGWSATRPVSLVASTFNGKALTISGGTDLVSDLVVVGTTPSGSPTLVGSVAATTNASGNQMCVIAYSTIDGTGPAVGQGCAAFSSDGSGSFKVYFASTAATGVNSARVQVHAVAGSTQVDDVRLHVLY